MSLGTETETITRLLASAGIDPTDLAKTDYVLSDHGTDLRHQQRAFDGASRGRKGIGRRYRVGDPQGTSGRPPAHDVQSDRRHGCTAGNRVGKARKSHRCARSVRWLYMRDAASACRDARLMAPTVVISSLRPSRGWVARMPVVPVASPAPPPSLLPCCPCIEKGLSVTTESPCLRVEVLA